MKIEEVIVSEGVMSPEGGLALVPTITPERVITLSEVIEVMLQPYKPNARYLCGAKFNYPSIEGDFAIPAPCYCEETGHFNLVELFICYNQLAYTFFGYSAQEGLIGDYGKIPIEKFNWLRHKNTLITRVKDIRFRRQIDPKKFSGSIDFGKAREFRGSSFFDTEFKFWDEAGGNVGGEVLIARVG